MQVMFLAPEKQIKNGIFLILGDMIFKKLDSIKPSEALHQRFSWCDIYLISLNTVLMSTRAQTILVEFIKNNVG